MAYITEDEATSKRCPMTLNSPAHQDCYGSGCMAWVAETRKITAPSVSRARGVVLSAEIVHQPTGRGRCGLVIK